MNDKEGLSFDRLLELLAEKLATKLAQEPGRLYPRLLTIDQAAVYLGWTHEAAERLADSRTIPTVQLDRRVVLDRLDLDKWINDNKTGWV